MVTDGTPKGHAVYERPTAHTFARDWLRTAIITGELSGGTRLVQAEIAERLAISTTPLREALRDLAAEGLVDFDPHRGAVVHGISHEEFQEIYSIRELLEPFAARLAAERITDEEVEEATALVERMENKPEDDTASWTELNRRFHAVLTDAARSPRLQAILKSLRDSSALYVAFVIRSRPVQLKQADEEHRALLEAVRRRDPGAAADAALRHIRGTALQFGLTSTERPADEATTQPA